ncbi:hypothetical protein CLV96_3546 [Leptospira meyeri]|uniref:Uncharacterized protein n=2 Tax=Leptospira meyeri TaxID=29508 RepID=A0A4R8MQF5_LEPME|nr:hypothetical protein LEP1GSC017_0768 [Leptospira meyeri serovar Hardjo str. Went 5]TDY67990.1 hypothetical protein CLV96_3546 [Leptospira meyeri]
MFLLMEDNLKINRIWKHKTISKQFLALFTLVFAVVLVNCSEGKKEDMSSAILAPLLLSTYATNLDLPEPALNSVNLTVGDAKFTKTIGVCRGNFGVDDNVMIPGNDLTLPSFFLHKVDFTKTSDVSVTASGNFLLNVDMPGGGGYDPVTSCPVKIMENSNTIYDIQVKDCPVDKIFGAVTPPVNIISFRVRCTKGL